MKYLIIFLLLISVASAHPFTNLNDGQTVNINSDFVVTDTISIDKQITVEGNFHTATISISDYQKKAFDITQSTTFNNLTFVLTDSWNNVMWVENVNNVQWNNIHIETSDSLGMDSLKEYPASAGIYVTKSNNFTINNYTTYNSYVPLVTLYSKNVTVNKYDFISTRITEGCECKGAIHIGDGSKNITIGNGQIKGYDVATRLDALIGGDILINKIKIHHSIYKDNKMGLKGTSNNLSVEDSTFNNTTIDAAFWGFENYQLTNTTFQTMVSLPQGKSLDVKKWSLKNITINGTSYDVSAGYDIVGNLTGTPPYNLTLAYNKTKISELNILPSSMKVYHVVNETTTELLTPTTVDTSMGTLTVRTNSLSPFAIIFENLPVPIMIYGDSSDSGYYNPDFYEQKDGQWILKSIPRFYYSNVNLPGFPVYNLEYLCRKV